MKNEEEKKRKEGRIRRGGGGEEKGGGGEEKGGGGVGERGEKDLSLNKEKKITNSFLAVLNAILPHVFPIPDTRLSLYMLS
jgi:hypothetical protein